MAQQALELELDAAEAALLRGDDVAAAAAAGRVLERRGSGDEDACAAAVVVQALHRAGRGAEAAAALAERYGAPHAAPAEVVLLAASLRADAGDGPGAAELLYAWRAHAGAAAQPQHAAAAAALLHRVSPRDGAVAAAPAAPAVPAPPAVTPLPRRGQQADGLVDALGGADTAVAAVGCTLAAVFAYALYAERRSIVRAARRALGLAR